jgi:hypothetical protein
LQLVFHLLLDAPVARPRIDTNAGAHDHIMNIEHLASRIRSEFQEMPGLNLTLPQAQRLWGLTPDVCAHVVDELVNRSVLQRCGARFRLRD